jgi:alkanesulfonate monooxygenase SsuD/methylene tetrahydromethanopterin reductase-like flavin-dependent oxidoreductase (luciferase family)
MDSLICWKQQAAEFLGRRELVVGQSFSAEDNVVFDIVLPTYGGGWWRSDLSYNQIEAISREAEKFGFRGLWVSDHLISPASYLWRRHLRTYPLSHPPPSATKPGTHDYAILEGWTLASALAIACKKMRVGSFVLCNSFRLPSLVAKMASTLDVISGGRVDLGLGSGWFRLEHEMYGVAWDSYQTRYDKLREAVQLMKLFFRGNTVSFNGKYYSLKEAVLSPAPIQQPRPPIYLGGMSDGIVKLVAEEADGWIPVNLPPNEIENKMALLNKYARELGRPLPDTICAIDNVIVSEDETEIVELKKSKLGRTDIREEDPWVAGTPDQCLHKLSQYITLGIKRFAINFLDPSPQTLRIFSEQVMNQFAKGDDSSR